MTALSNENIPTMAELKKRQKIFQQLGRLGSSDPPDSGPFPTTEQMQRVGSGTLISVVVDTPHGGASGGSPPQMLTLTYWFPPRG